MLMYFIQLISVAVFVLSTGLFAQQPQSPNGHCAGGLRLRKEIRALTEQERIAFIRAAQRLQVAGGNGYDWLTARHIESGKDVHGTLMFLAFHRSFTNIYQNLISRIDPNVTLPYWESTADAFAMHKSPIFSSFWMGGNGWGPENCLLSGPFSGATRAIVSSGDGTEVVVNSGIGGEADPGESRKCMRRKFNAGNTIRGTYDRMYMRNLVNYAKNQRTFWGGMEDGPHTTIHFGVGGDMKTMVSSNDPLFYVHHSYVDKVWDDWLRAHPERSLDFGGTRGFNSMFANTPIPGSNGIPVAAVLNTETAAGGCYTYAPSPFDVALVQGPVMRGNRSLIFAVTPDEISTVKTQQHLTILTQQVEKQKEAMTSELNQLLQQLKQQQQQQKQQQRQQQTDPAVNSVPNVQRNVQFTSGMFAGQALSPEEIGDALRYGINMQRASLLQHRDVISFEIPDEIPVPDAIPDETIRSFGLNRMAVRRNELRAKHWIATFNALIEQGKMRYGDIAPPEAIAEANHRAELEFQQLLKQGHL